MAPSPVAQDPHFPEVLLRELRLRAAVLVDAIRCLEPSPDAYQRKLTRHARRWFLNTEANQPFSFVGICDALGLEPARIRRTLRHLLRAAAPANDAAQRSALRDRARNAIASSRACH